MQVNVEFKEGKNKSKKDYQQLVCDKLEKLDCFNGWEKVNEQEISIPSTHSISDRFIRVGLLQIKLNDIANFGGDEDHILYLELDYYKTWKDVWKAIKNIKEINYKIIEEE